MKPLLKILLPILISICPVITLAGGNGSGGGHIGPIKDGLDSGKLWSSGNAQSTGPEFPPLSSQDSQGNEEIVDLILSDIEAALVLQKAEEVHGWG